MNPKPITRGLLSILACPDCRGSLGYNDVKHALSCSTCRISFKIKQGVPVLLSNKDRS
ncbi:MAG: Trm112 family protein [Nanoarchaeota archaeon]